MYTPRYNREDDPVALLAFLKAHSFATLITVGPGGSPRATHLPFVVTTEGDGSLEGLRLVAHLARANPQWEDFASGREAMAIFQGPHAYISPRHYEKPLSVPTWNYVALHAYGVPQLRDTPEEKRQILDLLIAQEEAGFADQLAAYPDEFVQGKLRAIVAFDMPITRLETRYKLSQDRTPTERQTIIESLSVSSSEAERHTAAMMAEREHR